jgi:hypothetical protein
MKMLFVLMFGILSTTVLGQTVTGVAAFKKIRSLLVDLNNDGRKDTIVLSSSLPDNTMFNRISVLLTGSDAYVYTAKHGWTNVDPDFLVENRNAIRSKKVFLSKAKGQAVLLLFGVLTDAGYREEFSIIHIKDNKARMVFDHMQDDIDVEIPKTLRDLDNDGRMDFVFTGYREVIGPSPADSLSGTIEVYCPYWVYTIDTDCTLNKVLTRKFNEDNYVFAGFDYSEEIGVFIPANGGKPRACKYDQTGRLSWITQ